MATEFTESSALPFEEEKPDEEKADEDKGWSTIPTRKRLEVVATHVLWDWDNNKLPTNYDIATLIPSIEAGLKKYDDRLSIQTFTASGDFYGLSHNEEQHCKKNVSEQRIFHMKTNSFEVFVVPSRVRECVGCSRKFPNMSSWNATKKEDHISQNYQDRFSRLMDVGDGILARQIKFLHFDHPPPGVVLLLTGDGDFLPSMEFLVDRGYRVLVANTTHSPALQMYARAVWQWENLIEGKSPLRTWPDRDGRTANI